MAEKGGYKHFMLKEIFEQPRAVRDTTLGRVGQETGRIFLDEMDITPKEFREFESHQDHRLRHQLARGAGGQVHDREAGAHSGGSGLWQRVPLSRSDRLSKNMLTVVISQSGETADTLAAQREAKQQRLEDTGHLQRGRIHDHARGGGHVDTHAGPEIGVASTKAFTASSPRCSFWRCIWGRCARR